MTALRDSLAVGLGGAVGTLLRYLAERAAPHLPGAALEVLGINLVGAYAIGLLMEIFFQRGHGSPRIRLAATTGLLGGFTTFGTMMGQVTALAREGLLLPAVLLGAGQPVVGIMATLLGQSTARVIQQRF
ncbi:MAG: CrcB family protein [Thermaerobacter sp.]|nr:CrcB family protein [Thermaerobacter sp.]